MGGKETIESSRLLSWSALLSHWARFAQSALALPTDGEGGRLRAAVPSIISLQAVTHALAELNDLPPEEYSLGQDRAAVIIRQAATDLHAVWKGEPLPAGIVELLDDARAALTVTRENGVEAIAAEPARVEDHAGAAAAVLAAGHDGDLWLLNPGVTVAAGVPIAFLKGRGGRPAPEGVCRALIGLLPKAEFRRAPGMRQVYRTTSDAGAEDVVAPMETALEAGRPLLMPVVIGGVREG